MCVRGGMMPKLSRPMRYRSFEGAWQQGSNNLIYCGEEAEK